MALHWTQLGGVHRADHTPCGFIKYVQIQNLQTSELKTGHGGQWLLWLPGYASNDDDAHKALAGDTNCICKPDPSNKMAVVIAGTIESLQIDGISLQTSWLLESATPVCLLPHSTAGCSGPCKWCMATDVREGRRLDLSQSHQSGRPQRNRVNQAFDDDGISPST